MVGLFLGEENVGAGRQPGPDPASVFIFPSHLANSMSAANFESPFFREKRACVFGKHSLCFQRALFRDGGDFAEVGVGEGDVREAGREGGGAGAKVQAICKKQLKG